MLFPNCRRWLLLSLLVAGGSIPLTAQEKSVRPGINDSFQNPDVTEFVGRFEIESREVFAKRAEIVAACEVQPGQTVADIGAGTGLFTRLFADRVGPNGVVIAVDIAQKFLDHIVQSSRDAGLTNVATRLCTVDSVELEPESIDVAFICDTYHHFEFPLKTMASLHKALKPGGRVFVIDFRRVPGQSSEWVLGHVRAGQEVFESEIVQSGFQKRHEPEGLLQENYLVEFVKSATPGLAELRHPIIAGYGGVAPVPDSAVRPQSGRVVLFDVTATADPAAVNKGLDRAARLLNLYGASGLQAQDVEISVVLHGEATRSALNDEFYAARFGTESNPNRPLIDALRKAGVRVFVCGQALNYKGFPTSAVAEGVTLADAALTVIVDAQARGAAYVPVP